MSKRLPRLSSWLWRLLRMSKRPWRSPRTSKSELWRLPLTSRRLWKLLRTSRRTTQTSKRQWRPLQTSKRLLDTSRGPWTPLRTFKRLPCRTPRTSRRLPQTSRRPQWPSHIQVVLLPFFPWFTMLMQVSFGFWVLECKGLASGGSLHSKTQNWKWTCIVTMQVCLHKIGVHLLGKLTICIDNAGPLQGYWVSLTNNALLPPSSPSSS